MRLYAVSSPNKFAFRSTGEENYWNTQEAMKETFFIEKTGIKGNELYSFYVPDALAKELRENGVKSDLFILKHDDL